MAKFKIKNARSIEDLRQAILGAPDSYTVTFHRKITLTEATRHKVLYLARELGVGWHAAVEKPNRTKEQNAKMWAMLSDIAKAKPMGRVHTAEQWKAIMMRACKHEIKYLFDINGESFPDGYSSSRLTIPQMIDLIDFMYSFGSEHGVTWSEPQTQRDDPYRRAA